MPVLLINFGRDLFGFSNNLEDKSAMINNISIPMSLVLKPTPTVHNKKEAIAHLQRYKE